MKLLLLGDEAIAYGAYYAGVLFGCGYPGTPSTEILETAAKLFPDREWQWAPNEKSALEAGIGASFAGKRAIVTMKHVGVNVAADPLLTLAYTGVNAGLVIVSADDPSMHSSQNEQDNRFYAKFAKIPMLEPSDSQEAFELIYDAFDISEKFDTPVLFRITTRIAHCKTVVNLKDKLDPKLKPKQHNALKYVMIPAYARRRRTIQLDRLKKLASFSNDYNAAYIEYNNTDIGIVTSGITYQYVKEALPDASIFKLTLTYPLPIEKLREFRSKVKKLIVIEELEPFIEEELKIHDIKVDIGKDIIPQEGELNTETIKKALNISEKVENKNIVSLPELPKRPPVLCPGCPHRGLFFALKKLKLFIFGDIGCYTLAALPPFNAMDTCVCMGAGTGNIIGYLGKENTKDAVAVIGDSTFIHSGITNLINNVYNKSKGTIIILDNRTTAMTGHQDHPATGKTLSGDDTFQIDFEKLARTLGVTDVKTVDPLDYKTTFKALKDSVQSDELSVIISKRPCALIDKKEKPFSIDKDRCISCGVCLSIGCPSIIKDGDAYRIDSLTCTGCAFCAQLCPKGAIIQ